MKMNHDRFDKITKKFLSDNYNRGYAGAYKERSYCHILNVENNNRKDIVYKFNVLPEAQIKPFLFDGEMHNGRSINLHPCAHHLNSSQIMCYNFFRPFIEDTEIASNTLIDLFKHFCSGLIFEHGAKALFEYGIPGERTSFDFYVKSGKSEIFCEIKYSEDDFAKKSAASSPTQFEDIYLPLIKINPNLWSKEIDKKGFMERYFQLFRNTIRATDSNKYVLFICPEDRLDLKRSFDRFKEEYMKDGLENIQFITWENLISVAESLNIDKTNFKDKYFGYKRIIV